MNEWMKLTIEVAYYTSDQRHFSIQCVTININIFKIIFLLLGRVALARGVAGYSHQTFRWTICRFVGPSVGLSVRLPVQRIVEKRQIEPGCRLVS